MSNLAQADEAAIKWRDAVSDLLRTVQRLNRNEPIRRKLISIVDTVLGDATRETNILRVLYHSEINTPIPMLLTCPGPRLDGQGVCGARHLDEGEWATKVHHTHSCQTCGHTWRPAVRPTVGVQFLPGFKNR
jgi:hypothetical protein